MASPEVLDFATLLAPLGGDNPAGEDLRANSSPTSPYYAVKDARSAARAAERQVVVEGEETGNPPDWRPVLQLGVKALAEKTKDLEIVAYLIEALTRLHGFAGLRDGLRLARELAEQFWDNLYPLPDEEGIATRVSPLTGLNGDDAEGTLINPIARVPLTEGASGMPYAYFHFQQAEALSKLPEDARDRRIAQGSVSMEMFEKAVAETPGGFFTNLVQDVEQSQEELSKLVSVLAEKCGDYAPPSSQIRTALTSCLEAVCFLARDKLAMSRLTAEQPASEQAEQEGEASSRGGGGGGLDGVSDAIRTRDDAFRTLLKVADFFRRTEPHTPVSYALEQAVRWGRMSLPELLTELIADETARQTFFKRVGIPAPLEGGGGG